MPIRYLHAHALTHACPCAWAGEGGEAIVSDDDDGDQEDTSSSGSDSGGEDAQGAGAKGKALRPFTRLSSAQVCMGCASFGCCHATL